jgi:integrase
MKRARKLKAIRNKARGTWVCFVRVNGRRTTRKLGALKELTQEQANRRAEEIFRSLKLTAERTAPSLDGVVTQYRMEKLSKLRYSTQQAAESWLKGYILPRWGSITITELQPRPVELWLDSLPLSPRTRGHLRELLYRLVDFSMWAGIIPVGTNPISLVQVRGSSKRKRQPRSLKVEEFHDMLRHLTEPFRTMALLQVCLGLRVSELLALRWTDVDWIGSRLNVEHAIVNQHLDSVKTEGSRGQKFLDPELLAVLSAWKQVTEFHDAEDWLFPSPVKLGRLPISYTGYKTALQSAAKAAGITGVATHSLRHTYRSWLDAVGTALTVQQRLMRHSDIRTTLNVYGDVVTDEMQQADSKIAGLALRSDFTLIPSSANN